MAKVAQLVEPRFVVPVVASSSLVFRPILTPLLAAFFVSELYRYYYSRHLNRNRLYGRRKNHNHRKTEQWNSRINICGTASHLRNFHVWLYFYTVGGYNKFYRILYGITLQKHIWSADKFGCNGISFYQHVDFSSFSGNARIFNANGINDLKNMTYKTARKETCHFTINSNSY